MNCQEFESLVHALASGRLLNAPQQARARTHAESCSLCLTRFQNERVLATALRAIAAESREKQSPVRIENALIDAFRGAKDSASPEAKLAVPDPRKPYKCVFRHSNRSCKWPGMDLSRRRLPLCCWLGSDSCTGETGLQNGHLLRLQD